ncbi:MAG: (d)CMP kinase [Hyphomonadaceae bacterium]
MIIAIDGTTASGKGTLAKRLAAKYALPHLDTGLLYRGVGMMALRAGVDPTDAEACAKLARELDLSAFAEAELRTAEAGDAASKVAALGPVRQALLEMQRAFAHREGGAILDGRDIGTVIAPDADVKFWVDAKVEERARRRMLELQAAGEQVTLEDIIARVEERDARDSGRADAPALAAGDAVKLDTSELGVEAMVEAAAAAIAQRMPG